MRSPARAANKRGRSESSRATPRYCATWPDGAGRLYVLASGRHSLSAGPTTAMVLVVRGCRKAVPDGRYIEQSESAPSQSHSSSSSGLSGATADGVAAGTAVPGRRGRSAAKTNNARSSVPTPRTKRAKGRKTNSPSSRNAGAGNVIVGETLVGPQADVPLQG